jgi:hypothetical protein
MSAHRSSLRSADRSPQELHEAPAAEAAALVASLVTPTVPSENR